ncbi:MAG: hypothetical protein RLZ21_82, partial [Pseudomonadota bacterium]
LIVVPRHPERFTEVANLLYQSTLSFERRSNLSDLRSSAEFASVSHWTNVDVLLGDSMGEMGFGGDGWQPFANRWTKFD